MSQVGSGSEIACGLEALLDAVPDATLVVSNAGSAGTICMVNRQAEELFGYTRAELAGSPVELLVPDASASSHVRLRTAYMEDPSARPMGGGQELRLRCKDGTEIPVEISLNTVTWGTESLVIAAVRDVTDRHAIDRALRESEARFRSSFEAAPVGMALIGLDSERRGRLVDVNDALTHALGLPREVLVGSLLADLVADDDDGASQDPLVVFAGGVEHFEGEYGYRHANGTTIWMHVSMSVAGDLLVTHFQDVSSERVAVRQLEHLALHDALTGLPNRALLFDRLGQALTESRRSRTRVAVFYIDLDRFKQTNDSFGHAFGDGLLKVVAAALRSAVRPHDTVSRMGGDEFVVVVGGIATDDSLRTIAERIQHAVNRTTEVEGYRIQLSASIGIAETTSPEAAPADVIRTADAAMYRAKSLGGGTSVLADDKLGRSDHEYHETVSLLIDALEHDRFRLHYQPVVTVDTGQVDAVEALLRIDDPRGGLLPPSQFLEAAERSGLIIRIGAWVINEACRQIAEWQKGLPSPPITSVNLSSYQLRRGDTDTVIQSALAASGADPALLCLELTESAVLLATSAVVTSLAGLRDLGVHIALDDFGTGYSSFAHLRDLPVDVLKIDRSFIRGLDTDHNNQIVKAIASLGSSLQIDVIAEGVETAKQLAAVRELGCNQVQGFWFSPPVAVEHASELIIRGYPVDVPSTDL